MRRLARPASRILALLLAALFIACGGGGSAVVAEPAWILVPLNPDYVAYMEDWEAGLPVAEITPPRLTTDDALLARGLEPIPAPSPPGFGDGFCSFPPAYDLRALGRVTPSWDTGKACGMCWTTASLNSIESYLAPAEIRDYSEAHLQLYQGAIGSTCGTGANPQIATYYFAAWRGPVNEADFDPVLGPPTAKVRKHVQNVLFLPARKGPLDNCWIKFAVTHMGAVYSAVMRTGWSPTYDGPDHATYDPIPEVNHAVAIVGWDDDYDRNKFLYTGPGVAEDLRVPPGNGAFIAKDNVGPDELDAGFFRVSYYDAGIGTMLAAFTAEPLGNYARKYMHDGYGPTDDLMVPGPKTSDVSQANVFTALSDEAVAAVSFYELTYDTMDYRISIHLEPLLGPVNPTGPACVLDVSLLTTGYYTVPLPQRVPVKKGQKFSVVLRGRNRTGDLPGGVPIEKPDYWYPNVAGAAGESWVHYDKTWQDLTTIMVTQNGVQAPLLKTNLCIKAFTVPLIATAASVNQDSLGIAWNVVNDGPKDLWVKPVARLQAKVGASFEDTGEVGALTWRETGGRTTQETAAGWILVPPGGSVEAFSEDGAAAAADRVAWNVEYLDPVTDEAEPSTFWQHLNEQLADPLQVAGTSPSNGESVDSLGLSQVVVTFDSDVTLGPDRFGISVSSPTEVKTHVPTVSGNQLRILLNTPLTSGELGGTVWTVHVPKGAVLSSTLSNPMVQDLDWSFAVTGVN